ncbi:MAG: Dna2/Cas4 domain-containing protein [Gammaproteobacteria bacterium]|nr:Dna2/Cas4 domain-containing protein [Gammaproteobacteria bacterium]
MTELRGKEYWAASGLGKCKRLQFLSRKSTAISNNIPYKWKNNAEDGHSSHIWRQLAIKQMGSMIEYEGEIIIEDLHYAGHFDLLVMLADGLTLCDIKNQNSRAFKSRQKIVGKILPEHKRQLGSYFVFLRKLHPELKNARMYYINRDSGEREEIIVLFTEEYLKDIINEIKQLNHYWANNILPPKEVSGFCQYVCQFYDTCNKFRDVQAKLHDPVEETNRGVPVVSTTQWNIKSSVRKRAE